MERLQLQTAEVVIPALEVRRLNRPVHDSFQQRNVLVENLILECFCPGGYQNSTAVQQGRQQIGQGLSRACSSFDDDVALFFQGKMDSFRHSYLGGPVFVVFQPLFENSARPEEIPHSVTILSLVPGQIGELATKRRFYFGKSFGRAHSPPRRGGVAAPLTKWVRSEKGADGVVSLARFSGLNISPD